jgi:hypothetical protein
MAVSGLIIRQGRSSRTSRGRWRWERHDVGAAFVYVGASVILSILGLIAGMFTIRVLLA